MKPFLGTAILAGSLALAAVTALAQSTTAPPPAPMTSPPVVAAPAPANPSAAAVPVQAGRKYSCQSAAQGMQGQDRRDQMQMCMMQARMDCLKQAIDQKVVGPQRKEFMKTCAG